MSDVAVKKGFCHVWHRRGGVSTSFAESPSRDFGSIIFTFGAADDHMSWRPNIYCQQENRPCLNTCSLLLYT